MHVRDQEEEEELQRGRLAAGRLRKKRWQRLQSCEDSVDVYEVIS